MGPRLEYGAPLVFDGFSVRQPLHESRPYLVAIAVVLLAPASLERVAKKQVVVEERFQVQASGHLPAVIGKPANPLDEAQIPAAETQGMAQAWTNEELRAVELDTRREAEVRLLGGLGEILDAGEGIVGSILDRGDRCVRGVFIVRFSAGEDAQSVF